MRSIISRISITSCAQSEISNVTVVPQYGQRKISLERLCGVIGEHRSMRQAEIVTAEGYKEWTGRVLHRFLVLELRRPERKTIWLRIDRRRATEVSVLRFLASRASTPANDTVRRYIIAYAPILNFEVRPSLQPTNRTSSGGGGSAREPPSVQHHSHPR